MSREVFYQQMQRAVDKFIAHIVQQISSGKARESFMTHDPRQVQRKNMSQVASKEYHEVLRGASQLIFDHFFALLAGQKAAC